MENDEILRQRVYDALMRHDYEGARRAADVLAEVDSANAASLRVSSYIEEEDADGAERALEDLVRLHPERGEAIFFRAMVLFMRKRFIASLEILQKINADRVSRPWQEKLYNLMGQCCRKLGDSQKSTEYYLRAAQAAEDWELGALEYSNYLFNLHYLPPLPPEEAREKARVYDTFFREIPRFHHRWRKKEPGKKLRIGYVSPDLCAHVVARFSYWFLAGYDKERFEVYVYMRGKGDVVSYHLAEKVDVWRDVRSFSPAEAAHVIYEDGIDILMDLSGHSGDSCLPIMAYKPAPVQISGIGYFASTGLSAVDYFLGDPFLDDEITEKEFTEDLLLLPQSHFCYMPINGKVPTGEAPHEKNGFITFGSFNTFAKVNDQVLKTWARILEAVPGSRLILKAEALDYEDSRAVATERIRKVGIDLGRVEMRGHTADFLREYQDIDIALDTFPYPGGGTTCDALYMGVPVVSLKGVTHGGRFGWSLLQNLGMGEFCAPDLDSYVERAVTLAGDRELIRLLRTNLRNMMMTSPLMDRRSYMGALEEGYEMIWERFLAQQEPPLLRDAPRLAGMMNQLVKAGETRQALAIADGLLAAKPFSRSMAEDLSILYLDEEETENAAAAVSLLPEDYPLGNFLRAKVLFLQKDRKGAEELCREIAEKGGLGFPWSGLEHRLLAEIHKARGEMEEAAREHLLTAEDMHRASLETDKDEYGNYLLMLHYTKRSRDREFMFREACRYKEFLKERPSFSHLGHRHHEKIRVGYLSPDFRRHVVACFSRVFFQGADASSFEIYGYADCLEDDVSRKLKADAAVWRNVKGCSSREIAELIYEDEIDILVDLSGHTGESSLAVLALRPAPVQLCGIGYFSTTGVPEVDYFIVDSHTAPPGEERFFTEKLLRLPHSQFCYRQVVEVPEPSPESPVAERGFITFGSMNNMNKVSDEVLAAWSRILEALPMARLLLKHGALDEEERRTQELRRMEKAGIDLSRVDMEGFTVDYLQEYRRMDIALDTFPYPGGGTTCDALYMGVPVISLAENSNHGRFGCSLLENLGLGDLCGKDPEEYAECAIRLAKDVPRLQEIHGSLRQRMEESAVMDQKIYMKDLEDAYRAIWEDFVKNCGTRQEK